MQPLNNRMYTVRSPQPPGPLLGVRDARGASYVVAFADRAYAELVRGHATGKNRIELRNRHPQDASMVINRGLEQLNANLRVDDVYVDETAHLFIEKRTSINPPACVLGEASLAELLSMPFDKNVGVAFGVDLLLEDAATLVFQAYVVDPANELRLFKPESIDR